MKPGHVYILGSKTGTLYTGVTSDLNRRVLQHRAGIRSRFASKYNCDRLVCSRGFEDISSAIAHEKQIKGWTRAKKIALIETHNPEWKDLAKIWGRRIAFANENMAEIDARAQIGVIPSEVRNLSDANQQTNYKVSTVQTASVLRNRS